jgi:hypothetical protein
MSAKHFDDGKPDLSLIPSVAEEAMARAMMYGTNKYGRYNYCNGHEAGKLIASAKRHLSAWYNGEENDKESGVSHLGHAMCNIAMLLRQIELGTMKDDRYSPEKPVSGLAVETTTRTYMVDEKRGVTEYDYYDHESMLQGIKVINYTGLRPSAVEAVTDAQVKRVKYE